MIAVNDITMRFGSRILFEDVTTTFMAGRRYAISGPNGAGKSTFMKILTGEQEPTKGNITRPKKLGVLRQDQFAFDKFRVIDTVIMGNSILWKALEERDLLYAKPHDELTNDDGMRLGELEGIVGEEGGYTAEADAGVLLDGLGIEAELHERMMGELQGGQKVRVLLAQALFGTPSALLLDRAYQQPRPGFRSLVERVSQRIQRGVDCDLSRSSLSEQCLHPHRRHRLRNHHHVSGGYDDMVLAKTQIRTRMEADNAVREKKIAQLNDFIARFSAGTRSAQATSRKKEVERLQTSELARSNIQRPYIKFTTERPSGRLPLEIKHLSKSYDDLEVIKNFSASITRGEKIAFTGRNGAGKSTMLKSLIHNAGQFIGDAERAFPIDSGNIVWGHEATVGYFPQDFGYTIDKTKGITALEWLWQFQPQATQEEIRGFLGQMLFSGEDALKPTVALSGGECARLIFCRLMIQKPNFLVLDEPTNNLDLESINALNIALQKYEGTVLLVTHDEDVLDEVATRIWHFREGKIHDFKGKYEDFLTDAQSKAS